MVEYALIATLGAQPQVVTLTLDMLRAEGYTISRLVLVYTQEQAVLDSKAALEAELARMGEDATFTLVRDRGEPVERVLRESEVAALLSALSSAIMQMKALGLHIHLSITGGSKVMAAQAMVAAQWFFGEADRVWHMHSPGWRRGGRRIMHVTPGSRHMLIPVHLVRWATISPLVQPGGGLPAATPVLPASGQAQLQAKAAFVQRALTPAEREVLELAAQGLDSATIGRLLTKSPKTVDNQLHSIYAKCNDWDGLPEQACPMHRTALVAEFGPLYRSG